MRKLFLFFISCLIFANSKAQVPSASQYWQMEMERKMEALRIQDSVAHAQDSLQMLWLKAPSPERPNQFLDSLKDAYTVNSSDLTQWRVKFGTPEGSLTVSQLKAQREVWVIIVIGVLILLFAILRINYSYHLEAMLHAIYSSTVLTQINKAEKFYNRWAFVFLYVLFGFVYGMFFFLGARSYFTAGIGYSPLLYIAISLGVLIYLSVKVFVVKLLGFIFENPLLSKEYNSILFLSYFNAAIFIFPVILAFAFLPNTEINWLFELIFFVVFTFFSLQLLRACYYALMTYKFSKFYLFLYFCTLEIGPLLIVVKAVGL